MNALGRSWICVVCSILCEEKVRNHLILMRFYSKQKREKIESNQIRGIFIGRISFFYNLLSIGCLLIAVSISICVCISPCVLFAEICTQHPTTHSSCHKEIYLFDIPATFSIPFPFIACSTICLSILSNWFGWICYCSLSLFSRCCLILFNNSFIFIGFRLWNVQLYGDSIMLQLCHCLLDLQAQILKVYSILSIEYWCSLSFEQQNEIKIDCWQVHKHKHKSMCKRMHRLPVK